jgi:hypothetical protein
MPSYKLPSLKEEELKEPEMPELKAVPADFLKKVMDNRTEFTSFEKRVEKMGKEL